MASSTALTAFSPSSANLRCIEINGSNLTVNNGEMFSRAQYFQIHGSSFNVYNDSSEVFYPWEALPATGPAEYWIIVCQSFGRPGESRHVARKFRTEEERDKFDLLLQKFVRSAFAMKSVQKVTVYGDPWLVVSSAAVYTLQDMAQLQGFEGATIPLFMREQLYLKISSFFTNSSDVYPRRWNWQKLWMNDSSYKNLNLFDRNGNFIVDVELLESHGLLCSEYMEVQTNGHKEQNQRMKRFINENMITKGKVRMEQLVNQHFRTAKEHFFLHDLKLLDDPHPFLHWLLHPDDDDDPQDWFHEISDPEISVQTSDIEMDSLSDHASFNHEPMDLDCSETEQSPEAMDVDSPVAVHSPGFKYASIPCQVAI